MNDFIKYDIPQIKAQLTSHALDICTKYLSNGSQQGRNWRVGSLDNETGKSMSVDLTTGWFTDFATGDSGNLLDILAHYNDNLKLALDEATSIIGDTITQNDVVHKATKTQPIKRISKNPHSQQAYAIFAQGQPIQGTLAETYLRNRGIKILDFSSLKFIPNLSVYDDNNISYQLPCLIAGVTNDKQVCVGIQRIFLDTQGNKSTILRNKRSLGKISGYGVWLRQPEHMETLVIAAGLETALSIVDLIGYTTVATLGTAHMLNFNVPDYIKNVIIAQDKDEAGIKTAQKLKERLVIQGLQVDIISPLLNDFNDDIREYNKTKIVQHIKSQVHI